MMRAVDITALTKGSRLMLARAITLIESSRPEDRDSATKLLQGLYEHKKKSIRVGISGPPGVGKSTFISCLGVHLITLGYKVAVLAVDPSSPVSGGSILADKTSMQALMQYPNAFVRPIPAGDNLGGVGNLTHDIIAVCEVAGYQIVLVETVGVGQSEHDVANMVDLLFLLLPPDAGRGLQSLKKGLQELADLVVINKTDGAMEVEAKRSCQQFGNQQNMPKLNRDYQNVLPTIGRTVTCSALKDTNVLSIAQFIHQVLVNEQQMVQSHRRKRVGSWIEGQLFSLIKERISHDSDVSTLYRQLQEEVAEKKETPQAAAKTLLNSL